MNAPSPFEKLTAEAHAAGSRTTADTAGTQTSAPAERNRQRPSSTEKRAQLRQARAALAEQAVAQLLAERGFQVVATNLRLGHLEIDIVARRRDLVVVVEVRARDVASWTTGFGSITAGKRRRVREAARRLWRRRYRKDLSVSRLRLDAAAVLFRPGGMEIHYAEGAF